MSERITIRLDSNTLNKLHLIADRHGVCVSDAIRGLIRNEGNSDGISHLESRVKIMGELLEKFCSEKTLRHIVRASVAAVQPYVLAGKIEEAKALNDRINDAAEKVVSDMVREVQP